MVVTLHHENHAILDEVHNGVNYSTLVTNKKTKEKDGKTLIAIEVEKQQQIRTG